MLKLLDIRVDHIKKGRDNRKFEPGLWIIFFVICIPILTWPTGGSCLWLNPN